MTAPKNPGQNEYGLVIRPAKSNALHGDDGFLQFGLTDPIWISIGHRKTAHVNRERRVL